jgi:hypothetical protein
MNSSDTAGLIPNAAPPGGVAITVDQQQQQQQETIFSQSSNPRVLFFHLLFRTLAVAIFILSIFIPDQFVIPFVLIVLFSAFDFWTVKNVSGRILVGLRYWNDVSEDGKSTWVFESKPNPQLNKSDTRVFWWSLYIFPVIWVVFGIIEIFRFKITWIPCVIVGFLLTSTNLVGYLKCDRDAKKKWQSLQAQTGIISSLLGRNPLSSFVS